MNSEPITFQTSLPGTDDQPVEVTAYFACDRGEPGSLSVPPTKWLSDLVVCDVATATILPLTHDQFDVLSQEAEKRAGITSLSIPTP